MNEEKSDRHYSVMRYYPHPGHGVIKNIVEENLTLDEAREVMRANPPISHEEEVVIIDQDKPVWEAEVEQDTLRY